MDPTSEATPLNVCANCSAPLDTKYCGECGQKQRNENDLSLWHFFGHALHAFTSLDAKIFRSVNALLFRPGKLTAEWSAGREQGYMHPLQLFLVINVFYFIFIHFVPISTLTNPLYVQKNLQIYSHTIQPIIAEKMKSSGIDSVQFEKSYNDTSAAETKTLVIIMAPVFAILTAVLYCYRRRYFVEHLVFGIHFYAFFMIVVSVGVGAIGLIAELIAVKLSIPFASIEWDMLLEYPPGIMIFVYLLIALRRVFGGWWITSTVKSAFLTVSVLYIIFLYRFILFFTTIYTMDTAK